MGRGWAPHPAAADQKKRKEKGKPKNQKFSGKRKESPKIKNLRPYIIGRGWGPHPAAERERKAQIRNLRPYIIGRGWGPHPAAADQKKRKERKESPKIRNLRPYIIGRGWAPHPAAADQKKRKEKGKPKNQKFEALLYNREGLGPPPGQQRTKRKGKRKESPKIRYLRPYIIGGGQQRTKRKGKRKESPKIRNLRPYIIGRGWGPHPAAERERKAQKSEI